MAGYLLVEMKSAFYSPKSAQLEQLILFMDASQKHTLIRSVCLGGNNSDQENGLSRRSPRGGPGAGLGKIGGPALRVPNHTI